MQRSPYRSALHLWTGLTALLASAAVAALALAGGAAALLAAVAGTLAIVALTQSLAARSRAAAAAALLGGGALARWTLAPALLAELGAGARTPWRGPPEVALGLRGALCGDRLIDFGGLEPPRSAELVRSPIAGLSLLEISYRPNPRYTFHATARIPVADEALSSVEALLPRLRASR